MSGRMSWLAGKSFAFLARDAHPTSLGCEASFGVPCGKRCNAIADDWTHRLDELIPLLEAGLKSNR